ncbi:antitoxin HicB [Agromyces sp. NBRC 114283]|uniref:antitoxin HicB n=1 Tax=Agromyces sp. NBRC 114283 TaxID=2994521 RepID=UPI0024A254B3|nr:antitoxin HicB [Agromyces sp. NBRC 114283]GLU88968.1 hypothetical protein Agsp01_12230 [Agromyces sp. NBRC 114283]
MVHTADEYDIRVELHYGDFTALVYEFPSLSWIAETEDEARAGMRQLLTEIIQEMLVSGEAIPAPGALLAR